MNWDALGSVAELLGTLLVLVSVLYLAVQVKQNTNAVKAASHHAVTDTFNSVSSLIAQDTDVARRWRLGNEQSPDLTEDERVSYGFMCIMYTRVFETIYYQRKMGTMEEQLFVAEEQTLKWGLSQPGYIEWWESNPISFSGEYREYVNSLIREMQAGTAFEATD